MSKELAMLEDLIVEFDEMGYEPLTLCPDIEEEINSFRRRLKNILHILQEQEKVLNIIKEKNVDILDVKVFENYKHYCRAMKDSGLRKDWWLTEEEFDLLKEYFK